MCTAKTIRGGVGTLPHPAGLNPKLVDGRVGPRINAEGANWLPTTLEGGNSL